MKIHFLLHICRGNVAKIDETNKKSVHLQTRQNNSGAGFRKRHGAAAYRAFRAEPVQTTENFLLFFDTGTGGKLFPYES
jgi:hypothetical protein